MKNIFFLIGMIFSTSAFAQLPEVQFEGWGVGTFGAAKNGSQPNTHSHLSFENTSLMVTASQDLYSQSTGTFGIEGLTTHDHELFLSKAFVEYQSDLVKLTLGRTDQPMARLVLFPTLRDDDLIQFTNPLNAYSSGQRDEDHQYATLASAEFNQNQRHYEQIYVEHLLGFNDAETTVNSFGATYGYMAPPGLENFYRISSAALGFNHTVDGLNQVSLGASLNLNESMTDLLEFRFLETVAFGSALTQFSSVTDSFRANAHQLAGALVYTHAPFGMSAYELALTAGHKSYFSISDADAETVTVTAKKELGEGFEGITQFLWQKRAQALAAVQSSSLQNEFAVEAGFIFHFTHTLNAHLPPKRSLLKQMNPEPTELKRTLPEKRIYTVKDSNEFDGKTGFAEQSEEVEKMNQMMVEGSSAHAVEKTAVASQTHHLVIPSHVVKAHVQTLEFEVYEAGQKTALTGLKLSAELRMTDMDMGTQKLIVSEKNPGKYTVNPKFSMEGDWTLTVLFSDSKSAPMIAQLRAK